MNRKQCVDWSVYVTMVVLLGVFIFRAAREGHKRRYNTIISRIKIRSPHINVVSHPPRLRSDDVTANCAIYHGTQEFLRGCVKGISYSIDNVFIHGDIHDRSCQKDTSPLTITTALLIIIYLVLLWEDSTTRSPTDSSNYSYGVFRLTFFYNDISMGLSRSLWGLMFQ